MMKRFLITAFVLNLMLPTFAISYEDIKVPKPPDQVLNLQQLHVKSV